jgi:hypothetical protein
MEIKIKDEMQKYKVKMTHKELVLLREAISTFRMQYFTSDEIQEINKELFDRDEINSKGDFILDILELEETIENTLDKVPVW